MQKVGIIHKGRNVMIGVLRERLKDGLVGGVEGMTYSRQVSVDYGPSAKLGVLVVIPEKDLPKFA